MRRTTTAAACAALLTMTAAGAEAAGAATKRGKVVRVVDGDSVRVKVRGKTRTYGLLGVRAVDCYARQAKRGLRRLLRRGARVRLKTERGEGRRSAYMYRGRRLVNAVMLSSGRAEAEDTGRLLLGDRLEAAEQRARTRERGLWSACEEPAAAPPPGAAQPPPPPPPAPPADKKQQDIAEMDRQLQGVRVYTVKTENGTTDEQTAHLCPDHRFLYVLQTRFDGSPIAPTQTTGTWKVVDALVDPATGVRQAIVETLADGEAQPARTFLQVNGDGVSGQWDGQAAEFSRSDRC